MNDEDVKQTIDDIGNTIFKLEKLRNSLDTQGCPMSTDERELLKMVLMAEKMPRIINDLRTAFYTENHDMASETCFDYKCLMEMVTGVQVD
jgi:hypothetical protein